MNVIMWRARVLFDRKGEGYLLVGPFYKYGDSWMCASIIETIEMKEDPIEVDEDYQPAKKTRKRTKAPPLPLPLPVPNRSTRRAHRKHSSDQCPLPELIPISDGLDILPYQSFDRETTKLVLQLPLALMAAPEAISKVETRLEAWPIEVEVRKEEESVVCQIRAREVGGDEAVLVFYGKHCWLGEGEVVSRVIKSSRRSLLPDEWAQLVRFKPDNPQSDGFVVLSLRWEERMSKLYRGLVNQGNTCYMNSYLQMLFHLAEFRYVCPSHRRLVFAAEVREKDKFPATLQLLFYRMLYEERPVSPEQLVRSFGWTKKETQVQQDVQEFSCLFFQALQRTVTASGGRWSSVPQLFCGELVHYIQCCHVGTVLLETEFRTQNRERFYDLQIPLAPTLTQALNDYVAEQKLEGENAYRTEYFGLQDAHKGLKLSSLPPVMMLQLKRFQFNPFNEANEKVLDRCAYPESIDFAPWTLDPSVPRPYELYAVLVHEGSQASSGHYYVFIRLEGQWFRFNDERVEQVERFHALDYNFGGSAEVVQLQSKQLRVTQKLVQNKATAYMLVYLSSHDAKQLTADDMRLPQWLVQHTRMKLSLDEQKKIRKQSVCDISLFRWQKIIGKECLGSGLAAVIEESEQKIDMVPKNAKVDQWMSQLQGREQGSPYLLWSANQKETLINILNRASNTVSQLFKDTTEPAIFFAPVNAPKQDFLVVVKLFDANATPQFSFFQCLTIRKDAHRQDLLALLASHYPQAICYIEDRKNGLSELKATDNDLLPAASPSRNQLLIAVVEFPREGTLGVHQLYRNQLDSVSVVLKSQESKEATELEFSRKLPVSELRERLFEILGGEEGRSPDNLVLKYKEKRTGRPTAEAQDHQMLAELIKVEKVIHYTYSNLNAEERGRLREVTLHCRDHRLKLSGPIKMLVERAEQEKLLELAWDNEEVKELLPLQKGLVMRSFLLGRDRAYITDVIDENGRVPGKGQLAAVLERDRNSLLVMELAEEEKLKPEQRMYVLLHHVTKTGERFGPPRIFSFPRNTTLSSLRTQLVDLVQTQTYEFEGKIYNFNPFKLRLVAYLKDPCKGVQLLQQGIQSEGGQQRAKNGVNDTVQGRFAKSKMVRVAVTHSYIAKGTQVLKLNVE